MRKTSLSEKTSRDGRVFFGVWLPRAMKKQLKMMSARSGQSIQDIVEAALQQFLSGGGKQEGASS